MVRKDSDIVKPLLIELNPDMLNQYKSEDVLIAGGRTDARFQNISFELKKENYFSKEKVPDMAQSFGTLEFAGESEPVFERDKNNRRVLARRSYNLYSDVQKGENVVVEIPVQAGEKKFKYEQKVKLVNPKLYGRGYAIGDMGHTDYVLVADDIVAVEEK